MPFLSTPSNIPGHALVGLGPYPQSDHGAAEKPPAKRVASATNERYTALQRQVEELERIHAESRKTVCAPLKDGFSSTF